MKDLVKILKVLGDKNRLRIVSLLEERRLCVCELAYILGISQPSVSRHLKKLKSTGVIGATQDGLWTNYFLTTGSCVYAKPFIERIHGWLNDDPVIKRDLEKAAKADRVKLCCNK